MLPMVVSLSDASGGVKYSQPLALDYFISPFNVALSVVVSGTVNYSVQYTFDNIQDRAYTPAAGNWTSHVGFSPYTATNSQNLAYPVTAVRLVLNSGTGSVSLTVIQAGGIV